MSDQEQCGANVDGWTCRNPAGHDGPCLSFGGRVVPGRKQVEVVPLTDDKPCPVCGGTGRQRSISGGMET